VLISYSINAGDGVDEIKTCIYGYNDPQFVLYRNGRLIIFDNFRYMDTVISQDEVDRLLKKIEATGFSSIEESGDQYILNAPTPAYTGGWGSYIKVKDKTIGIDGAQSDYLVEPVKKALEIIQTYKPMNLKPYAPDSANVWAFMIQDTSFDNYSPTPIPPVLEWRADSIRLDTLTGEPHIVSDNRLLFLMKEVNSIPALRMVEQDGRYYLVMICADFK